MSHYEAIEQKLYATPSVFLPHPSLFRQVAIQNGASFNMMAPGRPFLSAPVCEVVRGHADQNQQSLVWEDEALTLYATY